MILQEVKSIEEQPELVEMMASYVDRNSQTVCAVCGLQVLGHGPESEWLGYSKHDYTPKQATEVEVKYASAKSSRAYRSRAYMEKPHKRWGKHITRWNQ